MSVERLRFGVRRLDFAPAALTLLFVAGFLLNACSTSPVSPTQPVIPTTGTPLNLWMSDWSYGTSVTTCRLMANWTIHPETPQDVTDTGTWESSDSRVAALRGKGEIASVSPGDCELRATFRDTTTTTHLRVYPGEPPLRVYDLGIHGSVFDATIAGASKGIEGALVEIIAGHNSGQSTLTVRSGDFRFAPPMICGPTTVRASKEGYLDAEASWVECDPVTHYVRMTPK